MRLVGLSLVALLVFAVIALVVKNNREAVLLENSITNQVFAVNDAPIEHSLLLGNAKLPEYDAEADAVQTADFPILQYDLWTSVAEFSSNNEFTMVLPRTTPFRNAIVYLDVTSQLENNTTGHLRVSINGKRRGEIILNSGINNHRIRVPLEPIDMLRDQVDVNLVAIGNNPKAECTAEWNGGAIVTVLPTSRVTVTLDEPITDYVDLLLASGSPVRMIWKNDIDTHSDTSHANYAWALGLNVVFINPRDARPTDVPFTPGALFRVRAEQIAEQEMMRSLSNGDGVDWPVSLVASADDSKLREFRSRATWILRYDVADMPLNTVPTRLRLEMSAVSSSKENDWLMVVELNGTLVHSEILDGEFRDIQRFITLPTALSLPENELRVVLTSDEKKTGHCTSGSFAVAQLGPNTALVQGKGTLNHPFADIQAVTGPDIDLHVDPLVGAEQANAGFYALVRIFDTNSYRYVDDHTSAPDPERGYVMLLAGQSLDATRARIEGQRDVVWFGFSVLSNDGVQKIHTFRGDDPLLDTAIELYEPDSIWLMAPPGFAFEAE